MKRQAPSLTTWVITFLISSVCFYFMVATINNPFYLKEKNYAKFKSQFNNFLNSYSPSDNQCNVLCWGSSLSGQAINHSYILQEQIEEKTKQNIGVYKFYMNGNKASVFPYCDEFFDSVEELNPALVLIEDHIILYGFRDYSIGNTLDKYKKNIDNFLFPQRVGPLPQRYSKLNFDQFDERIRNKTPIDSTRTLQAQAKVVKKFSQNSLLSQKLSIFKDKKIPIIILNVPRVGTVEKIHHNALNTALIDQYIKDMQAAGFDVQYWKHPNYLPFSYYNDLAHMNEKGMLHYSKWLIDKVSTQLSGQCMN